MTAYAALLRAVNVGGTGTITMADLRALCARCGLDEIKTYIQSGNVVFRSSLDESGVKRALEHALLKKLGRPCTVMIRPRSELERVLARNPFPEGLPQQIVVFFFDSVLPKGGMKGVAGADGERLAIRGRELFIHYPNGQGRSRLKVPFAGLGTGRNLNTVRKIAAMLAELA